MKILELFKGTGSFSKEAEARGHEVFTVDILPKFNATLTMNVLDLTPAMIQVDGVQFIPDVLWASPPCTEYSHAKRRGKRNIRLANKIVRKTLELIEEFKKLNPNLIWIMENPQTGLLKFQPFMKSIPYQDASYCKYGYQYRKQTRFWNNLTSWIARPICHKDCGSIVNGKHIMSAGNGRKKYTTFSVPLTQKYAIPPDLCKEMVEACEKQFGVMTTVVP